MALVHDEILQKDEFFRLFQLCQQPLEKLLAAGEIDGAGPIEDGEAAAAPDIPGHAHRPRLLLLQGPEDARVLVDESAALGLALGHDAFEQPVAHIPPGVPVEQRAEDRRHRHHHHPGQLRRGVQIRIQHHQHGDGCQHGGAAHHMAVPVPEPDHHRHQKPRLKQKQHQDQPRPAEDRPAQTVFTLFYQVIFSNTHGIPSFVCPV